MEILVKAGQFFLSLSILIVLHEFGHFAFAKLFKTRVEKFYLFFNPWFSLFKFKKGDTEYGMGWLPLGGYVKISGMIDESMDKEQMKQPAQPWEFRAKPAWQRMLIMAGGVMVNFVLALFIYSMVLYTWGDQYLATRDVKYGVTCDSLALELGFRNGDKIISVDGREVEKFHQIVPELLLEDAGWIMVERNGEQLKIDIPDTVIHRLIKTPLLFAPRTPFVVEAVVEGSAAERAGVKPLDSLVAINGVRAIFFDEFRSAISQSKGDTVSFAVVRSGQQVELSVVVPETGQIGVYTMRNWARYFNIRNQEYSFVEAIPAGIDRGVSTLSGYVKQLRLIFKPGTKAYESVGGFITIGSIFPGTWNWRDFWSLTAFLSIVLAFMNFLPIPALDGGHFVFLVYEMVTGRKPSDKFLEYVQIAGMIILFSLLIFANLNDVIKLFR
ncbi:MAG: RIP metalloprotease RseP [Bacteroidales bacterium]|nr:RIP metalloprotease RseP [Bacteroidales bacterium]MBN2748415.1 RIP metalloprotease RseP [Bacteroidales bacterium]